MKAITLAGFGGIEQLKINELPVPPIKEGEVLVQVKAISINPVDVKTRQGGGVAGRLKDVDPIILGWDIAGIISASASPLFKEGDEVFGMVNFPGHGKAYAEYVAAPATHLVLKPTNISFEEAAASTLVALTAWQAFHLHTQIRKGDKVLIHAASGGVGHFAVQLAKAAGAYVIGTSSAANKDFVLSLGADEHIDYKSVRFEEVLHDIDFVLDTNGGDYIKRSMPVLKNGGTIVNITTGKIADEDLQQAAVKNITALSILVNSDAAGMQEVAALLKSGSIKPHISQVFAFEDMGKAHLQLESHRTVGKLVITV
jgi:NADPH:quinone reductase-like Zn-dependent oxidoreductase